MSSRRKRSSREKQSHRTSETIEATLNRLTKSYEVAIECLGACHRASADIKLGEEETKLPPLVNAIRTARNTFERAILSDPLVGLHAPCLAQLWQDSSTGFGEHTTVKSGWIPSLSRVEPPILTSGRLRETVKKLSYLSLLNYADLLLAGCFGSEHNISATRLDRRVVDPIYSLKSPFSCWGNVEESGEENPSAETEADTVRLALVSYMDAAELDGSDPTVWFRMAVAARNLDNLQGGRPRYRRLERHALESAQACWLSRHHPPNRAILNAWIEWQKENDSDWKGEGAFDELVKEGEKDIVTLSLGRYSWVVLGRTLLRACREGSEFRNITGGSVQYSRNPSSVGINPRLELCISPLLTLPAKAIERTVSFLSPLDTKNLECSCRAISVAVLSARTKADHSAESVPRSRQNDAIPNVSHPEEGAQDTGPGSEPGQPKEASIDKASRAEEANTSSSTEVEKLNPGKEKKNASSSKEVKNNMQASRVSKRLKSQLLDSGRRSEREHKRSSLKYCLVGATLGISPECNEWKEHEEQKIEAHEEKTAKFRKHRTSAPQNLPLSDDNREDVERVGPASLRGFIAASAPATPAATAASFVSHVSIHVNSIYAVESHGTVLLSSCLMDVLELLDHWKGTNGSKSQFHLSSLQHFAINLLRCELWMKRCELDANVDASYEGYIAKIGRAIPILMDFIEEKKDSHISEETWISMKVRCHWLVATYLLWRARSLQGAPGVREAESGCLSKVDEILEILEESSQNEVLTAHLEGPGRVGAYWKKLSPVTLQAFRNSIKASSVVLVAQEQFVDAVSTMSLGPDSDAYSSSLNTLSKIGEELLKRYKDSDENTFELIDDFLSFHGNELASFQLSDDRKAIVDWFGQIVPLKYEEEQIVNLKKPCILTIIAACLSSGELDKKQQLGGILLNILLAVRTQREQMDIPTCVQKQEASSEKNDDDSIASDDSESTLGENDRDVCTKSMMYSRLAALVCLSLVKLGAAPLVEEKGNDEGLKLVTCLIKSAYAFTTDSARVTSIHMGKISEDVFAYDAASELSAEVESVLKTDTNATDLYHEFCYERLCIMERISSWHERVLNELTKVPSPHSPQRKAWLLAGSVQCLRRIFLHMGIMLSEQLCVRSGRAFKESKVVSRLGEGWVFSTCRRLLSLWEISRLRSEKEQKSTLPVALGKQLRVPLAAAIVGFCGSTARTRSISVNPDMDETKHVSLMEVVDTDASAVDYLSDDHEMEELIRVIELAVQCIHLVTRTIRDEDLGLAFGSKSDLPVPMITARVLNSFADALLMSANGNDSDNEEENPLWTDYKYGFRTLGAHLDKVLHRAYKILFGFNLATLVDNVGPGVNSGERQSSSRPENTKAAIHLYRCVMRACSQGKKTPPKAALMTIISALPETSETDKSSAVKSFLFSTEASAILTNERIRSLVKRSGDWEAPFRGIEPYLNEKETEPDLEFEEDQIKKVRKGLSDLVSQGALPAVDNNSDKDARAQCSQIETEVASRFEAMLYNLSRGSSSDCETWHRLSQLCLFKADMIADRLGLTKGFGGVVKSFMCHRAFQSREKGVPLSSLIQSQEKELELKLMGWTQSLGSSLGRYAMYSWSSFDSLKELQDKIRNDLKSTAETEENSCQISAWNEIARLYHEEKYGLWQQAWGGLFVLALRLMAFKCLGSALYIVHKNCNSDMEQSISDVTTETNEALGTALYTAISGTQMYGYPMQELSRFEIRDMAETALLCYAAAIEAGTSTNGEVASGGDEWHWDLILMMGKASLERHQRQCMNQLEVSHFLSCFSVTRRLLGHILKRTYLRLIHERMSAVCHRR